MRYIVRNKGKNRHARRSQYAVPSRSKPYCKPRHPEKKAQMVIAGRMKVEAFISMGIALNSPKAKPSAVMMAVKKGLMMLRTKDEAK